MNTLSTRLALLTLVTSSVQLASLSPAEAAEQRIASSRQYTFLGYSEDSTLGAWRLDVVRVDRKSNLVDRYTLIQIVDPWTEKVQKVFRASSIERSRLDRSRPVLRKGLRQEAAHALNPDWVRASSQRAWRAFKYHKRFNEPERIATLPGCGPYRG